MKYKETKKLGACDLFPLFPKYLKIPHTPLVAFIRMSTIELGCLACRKESCFLKIGVSVYVQNLNQ